MAGVRGAAAAAQTLNGAVVVGARLEAVRETLTKRVDEVGEKVDDVGVEVGEVKAELKEVHDDTHLRVQQDRHARIRGLCGVVSRHGHGVPPTRAAGPCGASRSRASAEAPPPEQTALETTAARLYGALAAAGRASVGASSKELPRATRMTPGEMRARAREAP